MSAAITHLKQIEQSKQTQIKIQKLTAERDMALRAEEDAVETIFNMQQQLEEIYKLIAAVMSRGTCGHQDYADLRAAKAIALTNKGAK